MTKVDKDPVMANPDILRDESKCIAQCANKVCAIP